MTVSLVVIMIEVTNGLQYVLPVCCCVWGGDSILRTSINLRP
jgi:H+/Cl- antiporter ClcA